MTTTTLPSATDHVALADDVEVVAGADAATSPSGVGRLPADAAPSPADVAGLPADAAVGELVGLMVAADRAMAAVLAATLRLDGRRVAVEEGMPVDASVRLHTGATRGDVSVVLGAAEVLRGMPATAGLFARGVLSWGHVRALVAGVRGLDRQARNALDAYLAAHADRLGRMDGDGRLGAIDDAVAFHRPAEREQQRAERGPESRALIISPRLDGSGTVFSDLDQEGFATVTGRLESEADTPQASPSPGDRADGLPRYARDGRVSRARQLADALVRICGRDGTGTAGAPVRFTVVVDADRVTDTVAGTIEAAVAARAPRVVRRAIERLACDAALDVVVRQGIDLLAAQRYRPEVSAAARRAIGARDGGCRFPSCRAPVSWCDVHHVVPQAVGKDHALSNLVLLCRAHHTVVHRRGWRQTLGPDGTYTITRHGRTWTTWPRAASTLPPPARAAPAPARAGPGATRAGPGATRAGPGATRAGPGVPADRSVPPDLPF